VKIKLDVLKSMKYGGWMVAERWGPKNSLEPGGGAGKHQEALGVI